jgi:hypothetical protein
MMEEMYVLSLGNTASQPLMFVHGANKMFQVDGIMFRFEGTGRHT